MYSGSEPYPSRRSFGTLKRRRVPLPWPEDQDFRILSIDGGGIRGIYPATFLAGLEARYLGGASVAQYFDLIAGTSTGGIIAIGLAAGLKAASLSDLYIERGCEIFPPIRSGIMGAVKRRSRNVCQYFQFRYDRKALMRILYETLGDRKFGEAQVRLCIPAFEGRYGEGYIFKTSHHPDFQKDASEQMTKVAAATAAAPTFFQPLQDGGYTFVDGGVWANNPIMIALVDALSCFSVPRERVQILSLGCGDDPYRVDQSKVRFGGMWAWRDSIYAAMRLQSLNALGQAGLLIGADKIVRASAPTSENRIQMDDWSRAVSELPAAAESMLDELGESISNIFLSEPASRYEPIFSMSLD
ncbi:MAG: CBASS cGAMP-activated phospholipase [Nitrospira sp.]|nr:CBASS cGAMP-activated phospholipase [Nitrospira sp.]MDE0487319.1 CBASS cGAMP-activated phospholipase [Nitrospira sp.]